MGGHGVGRLALSYYLTWFGACVSDEGAFTQPIDEVAFLRTRADKTYARGITLDQIAPGTEPLDKGWHDLPVVWISRDPLDALVSFYNWCVSEASFGKSDPEVLCPDQFITTIAKHISVVCTFDTLKKQLQHNRHPLALDMKDICGDAAKTTFQEICNYLNVPYNPQVERYSNILLQSFPNRIWRMQPPKRFPISAFYYLWPIYVTLTELYDFQYACWGEVHILDEFSYNGRDFTVVIPKTNYDAIKPDLPDGFYDAKKRESCKRWLDVWQAHCDVTMAIYNAHKMDWESGLHAIRSNQKFRTRFLRFMDRELKIFGRDYPHIVEQWDHFHQL